MHINLQKLTVLNDYFFKKYISHYIVKTQQLAWHLHLLKKSLAPPNTMFGTSCELCVGFDTKVCPVCLDSADKISYDEVSSSSP